MIAVAKAIAAGVPMGATLLSDKIKVEAGMHGTTFGGNPLACAASLATLDVLINENLSQRAEDLGLYFEQQLTSKELTKVRTIRRLGQMIGLELKEKVQPVLEALMTAGIVALPAGATVLRLLPPLVIEKKQLDLVITELHELLA